MVAMARAGRGATLVTNFLSHFLSSLGGGGRGGGRPYVCTGARAYGAGVGRSELHRGESPGPWTGAREGEVSRPVRTRLSVVLILFLSHFVFMKDSHPLF